MACYSLSITRSAEKEIRKLPDGYRNSIIKHINALADNPKPHGAVKLSGEDAYRIRIGPYRVVYTIDDVVTIVLEV